MTIAPELPLGLREPYIPGHRTIYFGCVWRDPIEKVFVDTHDAGRGSVRPRCPSGGRCRQRGFLDLEPHAASPAGGLVSKVQRDRVLDYIESGQSEGARLVCGGLVPGDPLPANEFFAEPTIFANVNADMRIGREEIFGPVLSILKWSDEAEMLRDVNAVEYGPTCSIWTRDLQKAHGTAETVEVGFVWVNEVGKHLLGAPFGGVKQSGIEREESIEELLSFTHEKNVHVNFKRV